MAFLDLLKKRLQATPGYAGGTLDDQTDREATRPRRVAEIPPVNTPTGLEVRPRTVTPPPPPIIDPTSLGAPPEWTGPTYNPQTGEPIRSKVNQDHTKSTSEYYDALQKWEPRGGKRGFKNSAKAALMMAADAVKANPNDPLTAGIAGLAIGAAGSGAAPNFKNRLSRQWKLNQTGSELQNQLKLQKDQAAVDLAGMVPVTLNDGTTVMAPGRGAGTLQSNQQRLKQFEEQALERKATNEARRKHWDNMDVASRRRLLAGLYKDGALNDPESLEYVADQLGITGTLRPKFIQGMMRDAFDENGNIIQVNRQTQEVAPVLNPTTGQPQGSIQGTMEAGRNSRATNAEAGRNQRAESAEAGKVARGTSRSSSGTTPAQRKAATALAAKYNLTRKAEMSTSIPKEKKAGLQAQREVLWTQIMDTYPGMFEADESGELRPKAGQQSSGKPTGGRNIDGAIQAFTKKVGRAPTAEETGKMKAALGQ